MDEFQTYILGSMHITDNKIADIDKFIKSQQRFNRIAIVGFLAMAAYTYLDFKYDYAQQMKIQRLEEEIKELRHVTN